MIDIRCLKHDRGVGFIRLHGKNNPYKTKCVTSLSLGIQLELQSCAAVLCGVLIHKVKNYFSILYLTLTTFATLLSSAKSCFSLSIANWEKILSVVVQTQSIDLKSIIFPFMSDHFEEALKSALFPLLTAEDLFTVLCGTERDECKFQAVCSWAKNKETETRLQNLDKPFSAINFKKISLPVIFQQVSIISTEQGRQVD